MNRPKHKVSLRNPFSWLFRLRREAWRFLRFSARLILLEFAYFFRKPKSASSQGFWLTTRYHICSMGLLCAVGIALIHLVYVIVGSNSLPDPLVEGQGLWFAWQDFRNSIARWLAASGVHLLDTILFTVFLLFWLYLHYVYDNLAQRFVLLFCIIYVIASNLLGISILSPSFSDVWLIMAPVLIIPALGNCKAVPLLLVNLLLHHLLGADPYDWLLSVASMFEAAFIMLVHWEYYRRELRLRESTNILRERVLEIELIKENMDSGLMLLDMNLKIRSNFSDMCVKLLHRKKLHDEYFPGLLRSILEENQHFINSIHYRVDPEGDAYVVNDFAEWEERIKHYFEMLVSGHLDSDELESINPLKYIKIYSYEGRSYISFHVSTVKVHNKIQYFMVLVRNDTGKVAGRYRILEHERKHLEEARLLFILSQQNLGTQVGRLREFARIYLRISRHIFTEVRNTIPPKQLIQIVGDEFLAIQEILASVQIERYARRNGEVLKKFTKFGQIPLQNSSNMVIISKSVQTEYIQIIVDCERFLDEMRPLFRIAAFFIRQPQLVEELERQKQTLDHSKDMAHEAFSFYETNLSPESQMLINIYIAFRMLLDQHNVEGEFEMVEKMLHESSSVADPL